MQAFSLLKYWRTGGGYAAAPFAGNQTNNDSTTDAATDIVSGGISESDGEVNADDGPFFDMEFAVNGGDKVESGEIEDDDGEKGQDSDDESDDCDCENEGEIKFTLSPASSGGGDSIDPNISLSPSDELFFKGRLVPLPEPNCKPVSPVKSSTKLRVLMLKLKKSTKLSAPKTPESEKNVVEDHEKQQIKQHVKTPAAKFFTVKFKVDEVPMLSIFTRENSSKSAITKSKKQIAEESSTNEDDKVFSKDVMNKYLKKVKPLYVRVSKRYGEKLGFSGHLSLSGSVKTESESVKISESTRRRNVKTRKQGISFPAKLRVVQKHLGKSKSASSTVTAADSSPVTMASKHHRDDSLLQQQDGIQSAIMHCKRSFKATREIEGCGVCEANEKCVNECNGSC